MPDDVTVDPKRSPQRLSVAASFLTDPVLLERHLPEGPGQAMFHQQRDFIQLAENPTKPSLAINGGAAVTHKSIFAAFLNALYESRRLKAASVIHQNRRLIAEMKANIINRTPPCSQ